MCGSCSNLFRLVVGFDFALDLLEDMCAGRFSVWRSDGRFTGAIYAPDAFLPENCLYDFLSAVPLSILADTFVLESTLLIFEALFLPNLLAAAFG
jgi:hypothetical protein